MKRKNIELDFKNLIEKLIFANTPAYLFKKFRSNESVQNIGEKFSLLEIKKVIETKIKKIESVEDLVILYAYIISLSMHYNDESIDFLERLGQKYQGIQWLTEIIALVIDSRDHVEVYQKINVMKSQKKKQESKISSFPTNVSKTIYQGDAK